MGHAAEMDSTKNRVHTHTHTQERHTRTSIDNPKKQAVDAKGHTHPPRPHPATHFVLATFAAVGVLCSGEL